MEHKLIRGGQQYLPFARNRIKALRATGLEYASQQFDIGGANIKVRIEKDQEYISIDGGTGAVWINIFVGHLGRAAGSYFTSVGAGPFPLAAVPPSWSNKLFLIKNFKAASATLMYSSTDADLEYVSGVAPYGGKAALLISKYSPPWDVPTARPLDWQSIRMANREVRYVKDSFSAVATSATVSTPGRQYTTPANFGPDFEWTSQEWTADYYYNNPSTQLTHKYAPVGSHPQDISLEGYFTGYTPPARPGIADIGVQVYDTATPPAPRKYTRDEVAHMYQGYDFIQFQDSTYHGRAVVDRFNTDSSYKIMGLLVSGGLGMFVHQQNAFPLSYTDYVRFAGNAFNALELVRQTGSTLASATVRKTLNLLDIPSVATDSLLSAYLPAYRVMSLNDHSNPNGVFPTADGFWTYLGTGDPNYPPDYRRWTMSVTITPDRRDLFTGNISWG